MRTIDFHNLSRATTENEVVLVVRDYLAEWKPAELAQIPEHCRPGRIVDAEDVSNLAYELTAQRVASSESQGLLIEMATFFSHAVRRLFEMDAHAPRRTRDESAAA